MLKARKFRKSSKTSSSEEQLATQKAIELGNERAALAAVLAELYAAKARRQGYKDSLDVARRSTDTERIELLEQLFTLYDSYVQIKEAQAALMKSEYTAHIQELQQQNNKPTSIDDNNVNAFVAKLRAEAREISLVSLREELVDIKELLESIVKAP